MCSTFLRLHQEENIPLNVADEVIQTEIQINVSSRIKMNKLGVQATEEYKEKKYINENMEIPSIPPTDILSWSHEKIAEIKAHALNVTEKLAEQFDYEYRIPITKSIQKFLSSQKIKKNSNDSRISDKTKSTAQTNKLKKKKIPKRSRSSRTVDNKPIESISIKPKKDVLQKKDRELKKLVTISRKTKTPSISEAKEKMNEPIRNISITKLDMDKRKSPRCINRIDIKDKIDTMIQQENKEGQNKLEMNVSKLIGYESTVNKEIETFLSKTDKNDRKNYNVNDVTK